MRKQIWGPLANPARCGLILAYAFAGIIAPLAARGQGSDPVEDLRQILHAPAVNAAARESQLRQALRGIVSISDLRRAIALRDWRDQDTDEAVAAVDLAQRTAVVARFEQSVHEVMRKGDMSSRLAVMNMLCEMGTSVHALGSRRGMARDFAQDLVQLTREGDATIRESAARTLGQILPDPNTAVAGLSAMLDSAELGQRLAAAEALVNLVRTVTQLSTHNQNPNAVEATRSEAVAMSCAVVPVAARGLRDVQPEIRRHSVEAIGQAADALRDLVGTPRALDEMEDWEGYHRRSDEERLELMPLINCLREQTPALTRALGDPDGDVRLLSRHALEDITNPQVRLLQRASGPGRGERRAAEVNPTAPFILSSNTVKDPLAEGLRGTVQALAAGMSDPDPRARRAAIDVLEGLGGAAAPAAGSLVSALTDPDQFVRWAAARTLGKIGPVETETSVPALAHLLTDPDLDLRIAAATALERYGIAAKASVADLVKSAGEGDAELRVAAIRALGAVGTQDLAAVVPAVRAALANPDSRVKITAAQVIGGFGPAARECSDPLRTMLRDSNPEVQKAASEALLSIVQPIRK